MRPPGNDNATGEGGVSSAAGTAESSNNITDLAERKCRSFIGKRVVLTTPDGRILRGRVTRIVTFKGTQRKYFKLRSRSVTYVPIAWALVRTRAHHRRFPHRRASSMCPEPPKPEPTIRRSVRQLLSRGEP